MSNRKSIWFENPARKERLVVGKTFARGDVRTIDVLSGEEEKPCSYYDRNLEVIDHDQKSK